MGFSKLLTGIVGVTATTIFFVIMILGITMPSLAQTISNEVTLADGRVVDITHVFEDGDDPTFKISGGHYGCKLAVGLYCERHKDLSGGYSSEYQALNEQISNDYFTLKLENVNWDGTIITLPYQRIIPPMRFIVNSNESPYIKGKVYLIDNYENILDSKEISFNVLPTKPIIQNVTYSNCYIDNFNTSFNYLIGQWNMDIVYSSAERINIIQSLCWSKSKDNSKFSLIEPRTTEQGMSGIIKYSNDKMDWGIWIYALAINKYGAVSSDTICSTDYITDPEILARIEEWRLQQAGVNEIDSPTNTLTFKLHHDHISIDIAPSLIGKAIISDCYGRLTTAIFDNDGIDISQLSPGVYILLIEATDGRNKTFKFIKS